MRKNHVTAILGPLAGTIGWLTAASLAGDGPATPANPILPHVPEYSVKAGIRFSTYNASLNRNAAGQLIADLSTSGNAQAAAVARVIQLYRPDVLLINEFDYVENNQAAILFQQNYLSVSQNGAAPIEYRYFYVAPSNTGIPSGFDLNNNGVIGGGDDAFGFGAFPGQFGMVVYSKFPIVTRDVRTFQLFLWKDMPGALLPDDANTPAPADWYSQEELNVFRLSSKSHWDIPIDVNGQVVHFLASHPTPPVFDGPEDRNGLRNHDEIRFWADYIDPARSSYVYDDSGGRGGLAEGASFVIAGDQNADPFDGDSVAFAINQFLDHPMINTGRTPNSLGASEQAGLQGGINSKHIGNSAYDTADFADTTPGNLRADYVLPSMDLLIVEAGVFWPLMSEANFNLVGLFPFPTSDHRPVFVDVAIGNSTLVNRVAAGDVAQTMAVLWAHTTVPGQVTFQWSTDESFGSIQGTAVANAVEWFTPVKAEVVGLMPGTQYYYRAIDAAGAMDQGSFRTAQDFGSRSGLRFGVSGDWRGELLPYPSVGNAVERDLDLFVALGDTVYADVQSPVLPGVSQAATLPMYRRKNHEVYAERLGFNTLADLRASTALLATIDDHEVTNDFAGGAPPASDPFFAGFSGSFINDTPPYESGLTAFQDYNPLFNVSYGATGDPRTANERKLYRYRTYGDDAAFFVLDARSFRDEELPPVTSLPDPGAILAFLTASFDPNRTMLSLAQKLELKQDLLDAQQAGVTWKFIFVPEPIQNLGVVAASDRFEGYAAERTEILDFINVQGITNVVFVAADIHGTVVNNLTYQFGPGMPQIPTSAFEVTTGAVAYDAPFGPTVVELAAELGVITAQQLAFYHAQPMAGQDAFLTGLINAQLQLLGYTPVGLEDSALDVTLEQGGYVASHVYGWTEFEIDAKSQALTVTTWGIDPYSAAELVDDVNATLALEPAVISRFVVNPVLSESCLGDINEDGVVDGIDLGILLGAFNTSNPAADLDGSGVVDGLDLGRLLAAFGDC